MLNPSSFLRYITCASQFCAFAQGLAISGVDLCLFLQCEVSFSSDNVQVARGKEDPGGPCLLKARMDNFDNSSSYYLFNKGSWITPGNSGSEPVVVDWLLSIFQKYQISVQWFPGDSSIGKLHRYLSVSFLQFRVPVSSLVLSFLTTGVGYIWCLIARSRPHSVSDGTHLCCQEIVTCLPSKPFV